MFRRSFIEFNKYLTEDIDIALKFLFYILKNNLRLFNLVIFNINFASKINSLSPSP